MSQRNILTSARHIVIEGPIGAGKTSLTRRLATHLDAVTFLETPEKNPFLAQFYEEQERYALPTHLSFLFHRIDQLRDMALPELFSRHIVADYLLAKDRIFAQQILTDHEYELYRQVYERLAPQPPTPDLVIFLQASPETLIARIKKHGIDAERKISDVYLTALAERYSNYFYNYDASPVMVVNSENLNFVDHDEDFRMLLDRIESMRGQRGYFNRGE